MEIARRFIKERILSRDEFVLLLQQSGDADVREMLRQEAFALCRKYYGNKVYIRGLIEFNNYCKNNCIFDDLIHYFSPPLPNGFGRVTLSISGTRRLLMMMA